MQKINKHLIVDIIFVIVVLMLLIHIGVSTHSDTAPSTIETTQATEPTQETLEEKIDIIAEMMTKETEPDIEQTTEPETEPTTEPPTIPETTSVTEPTDLDMLACVIYQEAGSDACCDDCRRRVADVVLNRVAHEGFPDTIYGVLTQKSQYGRFHWTGVVWPERATNECERHAVERAYRIAEEVLNGQHSDLYGEGYIWQAEFSQGRDNIYHCNIYFGR
jgi:spore germination cell wall hydrolase CwlJ-like protein